MANVTFSAPAVLLNRNDVYRTLCAQVTPGKGQPMGLNDEVQLQNVDPTGGTPAQLWMYGSDGRIYLYNGTQPPQYCLGFPQPAGSGQPLQLQVPNPTDSTQEWKYSTSNPSLTNVNQPSYAINDRSGSGSAGDYLAIYQGESTNAAFAWIMAVFPPPFPTALPSNG